MNGTKYSEPVARLKNDILSGKYDWGTFGDGEKDYPELNKDRDMAKCRQYMKDQLHELPAVKPDVINPVVECVLK